MSKFYVAVLSFGLLMATACGDGNRASQNVRPHWGDGSSRGAAEGHGGPEGLTSEKYRQRQRELGPTPRWQDQFRRPQTNGADQHPPDVRRDNPLYDPVYRRRPGDRRPHDRPYGGEPIYNGR